MVTMVTYCRGVGASDGGDRISQGTAWLYTPFALGTWSDFGLGYNDGSSHASLLQGAIWALEDEDRNPSSNPYDSYVAGLFGADVKSNYEGSAVQVMNLSRNADGSGRKQDQLVFTGPPPSMSTSDPVPDAGATLAHFGLSLRGLGAVRRRFLRPRSCC